MKKLLALTLIASIFIVSCGDDDDDDGGIDLVNSFSPTLSGTSSSITEGSGDNLVVGLNFSSAVSAGTIVFTLTDAGVENGTNYSTTPVTSGGEVEVSYAVGATTASFTLSVVDDDVLRENGTVTIAFKEVQSDESFNDFSYSYTLTIVDDEVAQINPSVASAEVPSTKLGESGEALEIAFEKLNFTEDVTASVDGNFQVSDTEGGTFDASVSTSGSSVFVSYAAGVDEALGEVSGTLTLSAAGVEDVTIDLTSTVLDNGTLFMAEYFATDVYTNSQYYIPVNPDFQGTPLTADYPTDRMNAWVINNRNRAVEKGAGLSLAGYPGAIDGMNVASIISDQDQGNAIVRGACDVREDRNTVLSRRFAMDGEITSGRLLASALIRVEEILPENESQESRIFGFGGFNTSGEAIVHIKTDGAGGFLFGLGKNVEGATDGTTLDPTGTAFHTESYSLNETYAVILEYEVVEGEDNDIMKLYVTNSESELADIANLTPVIDTSDLDPDVTDDIDLSEAGVNGFTHWTIRENADKGTTLPRFLVTGIRVANTLPSLFNDMPVNDSNPADDLLTEKTIPDGCTPPEGFR